MPTAEKHLIFTLEDDDVDFLINIIDTLINLTHYDIDVRIHSEAKHFKISILGTMPVSSHFIHYDMEAQVRDYMDKIQEILHTHNIEDQMIELLN